MCNRPVCRVRRLDLHDHLYCVHDRLNEPRDALRDGVNSAHRPYRLRSSDVAPRLNSRASALCSQSGGVGEEYDQLNTDSTPLNPQPTPLISPPTPLITESPPFAEMEGLRGAIARAATLLPRRLLPYVGSARRCVRSARSYNWIGSAARWIRRTRRAIHARQRAVPYTATRLR